MINHKKSKVLRELFMNDLLIGTSFWSLVMLMVLPFIKLPQSLAMVLYLFFVAVALLCLPFSLYKIGSALHLAKKGVAITATNISIENSFLGSKVTFQYEYDGHTYYKAKFFPSIFIPEKNPLKLLVDTVHPSKFIIVEFKKRSILSLVRERNKTGKSP
jgi:hypothetical protein